MARVDHGAIYRKGAGTVLTEQQAALCAARALTLGAYERISDDQEDENTGDRGAGVSRQREALQLLCQMLSSSGPSTWTIHRNYSDNDVSAFKDVVRPEFELLLRDLMNGVVEGIVVYDLDRLARRPTDLERVIDLFDAAAKSGRRLWFATVHDKIDLSSPDGLTLARVMVAFANKSSRDTARRVASKHRATALTGRPIGGTRPFGWNWTDGSRQ
jgi:DNA invertase Pin-like site-specific DNA recombinase